ncbi:predicted secreted protein containing a PDZ domain [Firmicutes bacterium CAG:822]|nr:predicted secreted protein containing a PDZ domain [Firmicutes bacterium CAG:822]
MKNLFNNIKKFIKEYYKVIIVYVLILAFFLVEFPYYISAPGGLINTDDKIETTESFKMSGSLNMAYVSEIHATIPTLVISLLNKDWDVEKEEEVKNDNETIEEKNYRNKMLLEEANDTALLVAYKHSDIDYKVTNNKVYITYVDKLADTNLKIGDQILKVDDTEITDKNSLFEYIASKQIGDKITLEVKDINGDDKKREATLINVLDEPKVGAVVTETFDVKSDEKVSFNFKDRESGSSGGLMLTLTIYSHLNEIDLTGGKTIVGTGTIDINGNVGEISGIKYKLIGAVNKGADVFLVPVGENYEDAKKLKEERNYDIELVPVATFEEALKYLENQ